ncbi:MAG: RDD family protein [Lachnospiraceae bacterium]|nr:RDD family protein [Lachnospiraceae bacterium]
MDLISVGEASRKLSVPVSVINYYYSRGLLPSNYERGQFVLNGYAFNELARIVLLQSLGVSLSDIEDLRGDRAVLKDILKRRINEIMSDPDDITQAAIVCQNICLEGCEYRSLDAMPHIEHIHELKSHGGSFPEIVIPVNEFTNMNDHVILVNDPAGGIRSSYVDPSDYRNVPPEYANSYRAYAAAAAIDHETVYVHPFCRFFSRMLDLMVCLLVVITIIRLFFGLDPVASISMGMLTGAINDSSRNLATLMYLLSHLLMFIAEPLLLHFTGTTLGKIIFSVRILDDSGKKLSLKAAYLRSFQLLRYGYGFLIPFYSYYRNIRSCIDCRMGTVLPWDAGLKHSHPERFSYGRLGILIPALLVVSYTTTLSGMFFEMPPNKGPLTEEAFYENYSYVARYNSINTADFPELELHLEGNYVKSVSFTVNISDAEVIYSYYQPMYTAFRAFAGASPQASAYIMNYSPEISNAFNNSLADFSFDYAGVNVTNSISCTGYARNILMDYLYIDATSDKHEFSQTFTLTFTE